jgi:ActR/RegA family two-component response regulator
VKSVRILNFSDRAESIVTSDFYEIFEVVFDDDRFRRTIDRVCEQRDVDVLEFEEEVSIDEQIDVVN